MAGRAGGGGGVRRVGGGESRLTAPGQQFLLGMLFFKRVNKTGNIRSEKLCSTVMRAATGI